MIQITGSGVVLHNEVEEIERLKRQFEQRHCILLPELLEPGLLRLVQSGIVESAFEERVHEGIGTNRELCLRDNRISTLLHVLLNGCQFRRLVEQATGCGRIGCFAGRVYRVVPNAGHQDAWHSDLDGNRLAALSLNLSAEMYDGGVLQIRDRQSKEILHEVANTGFGDAIVFRLDPRLQHRITEVEGVASKTAFAGWFQSEPDFIAGLRPPAETVREGTIH